MTPPIRRIPISAVIAEPARPMTIRAVRTGPSSRMRERATTDPRSPSAPNFWSVWNPWIARTIPVKDAVRMMTKSDLTPTKWICSTIFPGRYGGTKHCATDSSRKIPVFPRRSNPRRALDPIRSKTLIIVPDSITTARRLRQDRYGNCTWDETIRENI